MALPVSHTESHPTIVDGGYLSWVFGTQGSGINTWNQTRHLYGRRSGTVIAMDSDSSIRKEFYPSYKSERRERRDRRPDMLLKGESVKNFRRDVLMEDGSLKTVSIPGLEADDIVALVVFKQLLGSPCRVIGIDKDLLQLPSKHFWLEKHGGYRVTIPDFAKKMPKTLLPFINQPWHILLCLVLLGDQSDSIPRAVPPYSSRFIIELYNKTNTPFQSAAKRYGPTIIQNLMLAMLPSPWLFREGITPEDLPEVADHYVHTGLLPDIKPEYLEEITEVIRS